MGLEAEQLYKSFALGEEEEANNYVTCWSCLADMSYWSAMWSLSETANHDSPGGKVDHRGQFLANDKRVKN